MNRLSRQPLSVMIIRQNFFVLFLVMLMATLFIGLGWNKDARAGSVWSIDNIQVDQINADPRTARELAIQESEFKALPILLRRITQESDSAKLPTLSPENMSSAVEGFEVNSERLSAQRYTAQLTVSFYPEVIRNLLRTNGITMVEPSTRPMLILPILDEGRSGAIFDDQSQWRQAWLNDRQNGILVPWIVARSDDFAPYSSGGGFKPESLITEPNVFFSKRLSKNDVAGIVMASLVRKDDQLVITTKLWSGATIQELGSVTLTPLANESNDQLMRRAVDSVSRRLDDRWKLSSLHDHGAQMRSIDIVFQLQSVNDLVAIQKALDSIPQIRGRSLIALHRRAAQIQLEYGSDLAQLRSALIQRGFSFVTNDEVPILRLGSLRPAAAAKTAEDSTTSPSP
ncbi:MAG: DUF2066 domain-containing protein [Candidatus Pacebacteria bacterium]|nr:DUF2066 domain-containing protein [Candidatus Paceibacterota bacterium]